MKIGNVPECGTWTYPSACWDEEVHLKGLYIVDSDLSLQASIMGISNSRENQENLVLWNSTDDMVSYTPGTG